VFIEFTPPVVSEVPLECQQPDGGSKYVEQQHPRIPGGEQRFIAGETTKGMPFDLLIQFLPGVLDGDLPAFISCVYRAPGPGTHEVASTIRSKCVLIVRVGDLATSTEFCRCDSTQMDGDELDENPFNLLPSSVLDGLWSHTRMHGEKDDASSGCEIPNPRNGTTVVQQDMLYRAIPTS